MEVLNLKFITIFWMNNCDIVKTIELIFYYREIKKK